MIVRLNIAITIIIYYINTGGQRLPFPCHLLDTSSALYTCMPVLIEDVNCTITFEQSTFSKIDEYADSISSYHAWTARINTHTDRQTTVTLLRRGLKRMYGLSTKKHTNKGSKDGNKGQGSSLLLCVLSFRLYICQALEIVILIRFLMVTKK